MNVCVGALKISLTWDNENKSQRLSRTDIFYINK